MFYSIENCAVLIVAAGQSKRLGIPKQLLSFEGETLINRLIGLIKKSTPFPITLVLGANAKAIEDQLKETELSILHNNDWEEGMASSIRVGVKQIMTNDPGIDGIMILVCDQPFVTEKHIESLIETHRTSGLPLAACYYAGVIGTPALFHQSIFPELLELKGDIGAKSIIKKRESEVAKLQFEQGAIDIDTMEDYQQLIRGAKGL
jgi:molybdenum cofactor cytidylyltransferase